MRKHASVVALAVISLALVGSKKPAATIRAQQTPSGIKVVTNADGSVSVFQNAIKRNTNVGRTPQNPTGTEVVTNANGSVSVLRSRIKTATNSAPATNGLSK